MTAEELALSNKPQHHCLKCEHFGGSVAATTATDGNGEASSPTRYQIFTVQKVPKVSTNVHRGIV